MSHKIDLPGHFLVGKQIERSLQVDYHQQASFWLLIRRCSIPTFSVFTFISWVIFIIRNNITFLHLWTILKIQERNSYLERCSIQSSSMWWVIIITHCFVKKLSSPFRRTFIPAHGPSLSSSLSGKPKVLSTNLLTMKYLFSVSKTLKNR